MGKYERNRKVEEDYFTAKLRVRIKDNKTTRHMVSFIDFNFHSDLVLIFFSMLCHVTHPGTTSSFDSRAKAAPGKR